MGWGAQFITMIALLCLIIGACYGYVQGRADEKINHAKSNKQPQSEKSKRMDIHHRRYRFGHSHIK